MTTNDWLAIWQPLIIGLGAVVLGLLGNSILEWLKLDWTQRRTANAIRSVILQELLVSQRASQAATGKLNEWPEDKSVLVPLVENFPAYDHHLANLGLLKPAQTAAVFEAYSHLHSRAEWLAHVATFERHENCLFSRVPYTQRELLTEMNATVLEKLTAATDLLR